MTPAPGRATVPKRQLKNRTSSLNTYRSRQVISKDEFLHALTTGDAKIVTAAMMDAVDSIDDSSWLLEQLKFQLQNSKDYWIVGTSIVALGELGLFHSDVDPKEIYRLIEPFEERDGFRDWAEDALSDLRIAMNG
ncbi:hypothetical protein M2360_004410 [Rhizobium sp. SG_E_25_P2]|uniref:hypothetical protein n=1 Tax=Rhizobium sp. SG_E_25_P2 TaxID=2879942 RepID=UPI002474DD12|nr:hypothetical protein [Rhizobium sp. SG_E_25_P2]MDH6268990.1 hypothetical protein [Rhizobium sp. SG_E_25_P2]